MKALTKKEIIEDLKIDESGRFGFIGKFIGKNTTNHNLRDGLITLNMVNKLEAKGVIKYNGLYEIWADPIEIIKSKMRYLDRC